MSYSQVRFTLPRRREGMPEIFQAVNHPLLEGVSHVRNVYVGYMGTDKESVENCLQLEKALKCPEGGVEEWRAQGLLQLQPGDYLFLRDPQASSKPKDDVLAAMITGREHHGDDIHAHELATQAMLGPSATRTATLTAFERTGCAQKIRKKRCYSIGIAVQQSRRVVAPSASLDQDRRNIKEYQKMNNDLINSASTMLLNVQDALPKGCVEAFRANCELTGQPTVGKRSVYGTGSIQVNISAAGLSASDNRLANQLGDFGSEHYDGRDSPDHLTTMFANPDIPDNYDPGAFHILQLGVFVVLAKFVGVTFSGQRRHVGTAPTPPPHCPAVRSAYRFNVVCYPKDAAVDGLSRFTLASLPGKKLKDEPQAIANSGEGRGKGVVTRQTVARGKQRESDRVDEEPADEEVEGGDGVSDSDEDGDTDDSDEDFQPPGASSRGHKLIQSRKEKGKRRAVQNEEAEPLYITPEMINIGDEGFVEHTTNRATFARSGHIIMDRESHVAFMGRSLLQLSAYVLRQLPVSYALAIDAEKWLEAISFENVEGNRLHIPAWSSAPNVQTVSEERQKNKKVWATYQKKVRRFTPRIAYRAFTLTSRKGDDDDDDDEGGYVNRGKGGEEEVDGGKGVGGDEEEDGGGEKDSDGNGGVVKEVVEEEVVDVRVQVSSETDEDEVVHERESKNMRRGVTKSGGERRAQSQVGFDMLPRHQELVEEAAIAKATFHDVAGGGIVKELSGGGDTFRSVQVHSPLPSVSEYIPHRTDATTTKRSLSDGLPGREGANKRLRMVTPIPTSPSTATTNVARFPFLQKLTSAALQAEASEIHRDFSTIFEAALGGEQPSYNHRAMLADYQSLLRDPTSQAAPGQIRHIQVQICAHGLSHAIKAIEARWQRYSILLSSVHVWYWLDVIIKKKIEDLFTRGSSDADRDWLTILVSLTRTGLEAKSDPIILNPFQHPSLLNLRSEIITVANPYKRNYFTEGPSDQKALLTALTAMVQTILMECLEYPPESDLKDRRRAWLMGTLAEVLGPEFLFTQCAWNAWNTFTVKGFLGETSQSYSKNSDLIQPFKKALEAHPICVVDSETWEAYQSFKKCFEDPAQYQATRSAGSTSDDPQPVPTEGKASIISVTTTTQLGLFDVYLMDCLDYEKRGVSPDSRLHQFLQAKLDIRYPFREKAPSRIRMRGAGSPYHPSTIRTNAGIYSAIIFRGITYNTAFSQHPDSPMLFESFVDWEEKIALFKTQYASISNAKNFFCRPDAYGGQSIRGRSVDMAEVFWDRVQAIDWPEKSKRVMSFKECYDLFRLGEFPLMGTLCCYLLTCDLHYAGVCEAPTASNVASFMRSARGGSYHILPTLGYGEVGVHPPLQLVTEALTAITRHLGEIFDEGERTLMGLDLICLEHILCKFKRAVAAGVCLL